MQFQADLLGIPVEVAAERGDDRARGGRSGGTGTARGSRSARRLRAAALPRTPRVAQRAAWRGASNRSELNENFLGGECILTVNPSEEAISGRGRWQARAGAVRDPARDRRPGGDARARARLPARRRARADRGRAGPREDPDDQDDGGGARRLVPPRAVHAGPRARPTSSARASTGPTAASSRRSSGRSSATSSSPTRSTAPRRRCSRRCSR